MKSIYIYIYKNFYDKPWPYALFTYLSFPMKFYN